MCYKLFQTQHHSQPPTKIQTRPAPATKRLITDVVTKWNNSHDMIERFLEQQPLIYAALLSAEVYFSALLNEHEADITCVEEVLKALKPMKNATLVMSEESMLTLSVIAPLYSKLVTGTEESLDDTKTAKNIMATTAQDLGKRYANERETLCMESALDPRFKDISFFSETEIKETYSRMTDAVVAAIKKQHNVSK